MSYWSSQEAQSGQWSEVKQSKSHSIMSNSSWPHGLYSPWNSPGQNTGISGCSFLHRIFPTEGLNPGSLRCRQTLHQLSHQGSPISPIVYLVSVYIVIRNTEQTLAITTSGLCCVRIFGRHVLHTNEACVSCLSSRVRSLSLNRAPSQKQKRNSKVLNFNVSQTLIDTLINIEATPHGGWKLWISKMYGHRVHVQQVSCWSILTYCISNYAVFVKGTRNFIVLSYEYYWGLRWF